jgi:hypothetical protein
LLSHGLTPAQPIREKYTTSTNTATATTATTATTTTTTARVRVHQNLEENF